MSYSYYLLHGLALKAAFVVVAKVIGGGPPPDAWAFWALLVPLFALTLVPAGVLFLWVERPFSLTVGRRVPAARSAAATGTRRG